MTHNGAKGPGGRVKGLLSRWIPPILWMGFIFWMSTAGFSEENTKNYIYPIIKFFFHYASEDMLRILHFFIRKSAHFNEYGILSFLFFRALNGRTTALNAFLFSVVVSFIYAAGDEFHQSYVSVRTASPVDVTIDSLGAIFMQVVLRIHRRL